MRTRMSAVVTAPGAPPAGRTVRSSSTAIHQAGAAANGDLTIGETTLLRAVSDGRIGGLAGGLAMTVVGPANALMGL